MILGKAPPPWANAFAHGGGAFPSIIGRLEHGYNVRPDIVATHNKHNPRDYIGKFYLDSLVHEPSVLQYMIDLFGADCIALGSDYPFPLGEKNPGKMIKNMKLEKNIVSALYADTALKWLNLKRQDYKKWITLISTLILITQKIKMPMTS